MSQSDRPDKVVPCVHCDHVVIIPSFVKPNQIWVGICGNGHAALYSYPSSEKS